MLQSRVSAFWQFRLNLLSVFLLLSLASGAAFGHGGVSIEDDMCVMQVGPYRAHFTGYQPERRATQEFCEDIPEVGRAIFVIDFINDELRQMETDFRIIKDVRNIGIRAKYEDLGSKDDIERATVYYRPAEIVANGTFNADHTFPESGNFIGLVTARDPKTGKEIVSVFPFAVGIFHWGRMLVRIGLILVLVGGLAGFFITRALRKKA